MKYLKSLDKNKVKIILSGFILNEVFRIIGLSFWVSALILYGLWLVLNLIERKYLSKKFKIRHKDICK
ncbi:hypothetical protein [uncultured Clostridium sp.]|jgi:hypothetical protein|uniref:hypothetical protein n=1 Tax=uncultured Clostridium sp. TaxID=59620 RepID=UPI00262DBD33|nr:hypothetical protein [uncultured Clostridium sp.]